MGVKEKKIDERTGKEVMKNANPLHCMPALLPGGLVSGIQYMLGGDF